MLHASSDHADTKVVITEEVCTQVETSPLWVMERRRATSQLPPVPWTLSVLFGASNQSMFDAQWYEFFLKIVDRLLYQMSAPKGLIQVIPQLSANQLHIQPLKGQICSSTQQKPLLCT